MALERNFALFTGCVAKGAGRELLAATKLAADKLDITLHEMEDAACCGAGVVTEDNMLLADAVNARTFALAEEEGLNILNICGTCQGVMNEAKRRMDTNPDYKSKVNEALAADTGRTYRGSVKVKHLLHYLINDYGLDELKKRVLKPLDGLKVAPFYGCYMLRPKENSQLADPDHPDELEKIIVALGGEPVEYPGKIKCCGFPILMSNKTNSLLLSGNALVDAKNHGADIVVTPCPLCHLNMDPYQPDIDRMFSQKLNLPILHLPQLLALAFGSSPRDLKLDTHIVRPHKLIERFTL